MKENSPDFQADEFAPQQRRLLQQFLAEGEQVVPSTTSHILSALHQIQRDEIAREATLPVLPAVPPSPAIQRSLRRIRQRRNLVAFVAVAALVLAALSLFSVFGKSVILQHSKTQGAAASLTTPPFATSPSWSSVLVTYQEQQKSVIANLNPASGTFVRLVSSPANTITVEGIAHNGYNVLFATYDGSQTSYMLLTPSATHMLYTVAGKSGNAVWSTDDHYVFIATSKGIEQVDVQNGTAQRILPQLPVPASFAFPYLRFYRNGYLYVFNSTNGTTGSLARVSLPDGSAQTVTGCDAASDFWLSPSGTTVYYRCSGQDALYAVDSNGANPRVLRAHVGNIVGYALDGSVLTLEQNGNAFSIVQLGSAAATDRVLVKDVAPQATSVASDATAVAPYGSALVATGSYGKSEELWYSSIDDSIQHSIALPSDATQVTPFGWDRLLVPGS